MVTVIQTPPSRRIAPQLQVSKDGSASKIRRSDCRHGDRDRDTGNLACAGDRKWAAENRDRQGCDGAATHRIVESSADGSFASSEVAPGRLEVTFSGTRFESRDRVERYLLYRAALLAKQNGASWFGLMYLPGEAGPNSHPARSSRPGQHHYGHWQPHWNYYVSGLGWQPWHPEWGAAFWADSIDLTLVERYDAHAMIELGVGSRPQNDQPIFDVDEVIGDMEPAFR